MDLVHVTLERVLGAEMLAAEAAVVSARGKVQSLQVELGAGVVAEGAAADGAGEEGSAALLWLHLLPHVLGRQLRQRVFTPACMDYTFFMTSVN
jgi:hypothetical protein